MADDNKWFTGGLDKSIAPNDVSDVDWVANEDLTFEKFAIKLGEKFKTWRMGDTYVHVYSQGPVLKRGILEEWEKQGKVKKIPNDKHLQPARTSSGALA